MVNEPEEKKREEELPPGQHSVSQPYEDPINSILRKRRIIYNGLVGEYSFLTPSVITSGAFGTEQQRRVDEEKYVLSRKIAELSEQIRQPALTDRSLMTELQHGAHVGQARGREIL